MARPAIMPEIPKHMVGICRDRKLRLMTLVAVCKRQVVVVSHVAGDALHHDVSPCQREIRLVVIERRRTPSCRGMALQTIMAEVSNGVVGIRRLLELWCMALIAIHVLQLVVVVDMARLALQRGMRTGQRESSQTVIERCTAPVDGRVAAGAVVAEIPCHMVRVRCLLILRRMALITIHILQLVVAIDVARLAWGGSMRAC
jgi:hypothetical protein